MSQREFNSAVAHYAKPVREGLAQLRALILATAKATPGVGRIEEALRWGQFSFLTSETGSGTTIRIDGLRGQENAFAMYFHCQSGLIEQFKEIYGPALAYEGKRALIFNSGQPLQTNALKHCIALALTHHLRKNQQSRRKATNEAPDHHRHRSRPGRRRSHSTGTGFT